MGYNDAMRMLFKTNRNISASQMYIELQMQTGIRNLVFKFYM